MAVKLLHNVDKACKKVTPGNIAYYTIQHMKSGRRSTGSSVSDVMATATQLNGRTRLTSLEEVASTIEEAGEEIFLFHDVLSNDSEDPSTRAARKMDWQEFVAALPDRERKMVEFVAEGRSLRNAARAFKCSSSAVQSSKRDLALKILDFMGPDILVEVRRLPRWKQDIQTAREKMACRTERRH